MWILKNSIEIMDNFKSWSIKQATKQDDSQYGNVVLTSYDKIGSIEISLKKKKKPNI